MQDRDELVEALVKKGMRRRDKILALREVKVQYCAPTKNILMSSILTPRSVVTAIKEFGLLECDREFFVLLFIDSKKKCMGFQLVSLGVLDASLVHPRELFVSAIKQKASEIVIAHNHPTGDLTPSEEDVALTTRIQQAGKLLGVELLDHVIVGPDGSWKSLREEGMFDAE
jgi:DNA repair protein RadC